MTRYRCAAAPGKSPATPALAALAGLVVVALCVIGIAAFAGLLPQSEHVAAAMTAAPIIDLQVGGRRDEPNTRVEPRIEAQAGGNPAGISRERLQRVVIVP